VLVKGPPHTAGNRCRFSDVHRWRGTVVEVVDPDRRGVIASLRLDPCSRFLVAPAAWLSPA